LIKSAVTVDVQNLSRQFDSKQNKVIALDGISLQVREGEIFGILGPNGAGKTTLIRILSTLLLPTGGTAKVMGFDVATEPEKARTVMNMASGAERAGYDFISARGNLWFFSQLYGIPGSTANQRISELSGMLGLDGYLDRKFYSLSTGYKQRVTIARAFLNDPKVVFLDEPTIGLDVMTALSIRDFLKDQAKAHGRTIMVATHNMAEVEAVCNRVAIIDKGKILASDTPQALKKLLGAPALVMEISPPPDNLGFLANVKGVKGVTESLDSERGLATVKVVVESDECAARAQEAARSAGLKLLSSWRQETTLEEVFVALVGRGFREREEENAD
jgi:ABC-2 type transport system ATP-binding protein